MRATDRCCKEPVRAGGAYLAATIDVRLAWPGLYDPRRIVPKGVKGTVLFLIPVFSGLPSELKTHFVGFFRGIV